MPVSLNALLGAGLLVPGQAGDIVADQAAVQGAAGEFGDLTFDASEPVIKRREGTAADLDDDGLLGPWSAWCCVAWGA